MRYHKPLLSALLSIALFCSCKRMSPISQARAKGIYVNDKGLEVKVRFEGDETLLS